MFHFDPSHFIFNLKSHRMVAFAPTWFNSLFEHSLSTKAKLFIAFSQMAKYTNK